MANVYNHDEPANYVETDLIPSISNAHVRKWFRTTFVRHIKNDPSFLSIMLPGPFKSAIDLTPQAYGRVLFYKDPPSEVWAQQAILRGELFFWSERPNLLDAHLHMADYCATLGDKQINMSYTDMEKAVKKWDKELESQKVVGSLQDGVEEVWRNKTHYVVRLTTRKAFRVEGATMSHCLGYNNYFDKKHSECFSLRLIKTGLPVATMQVRDIELREKNAGGSSLLNLLRRAQGKTALTHALAQSIAFKNRTVPNLEQSYINEWFASTYDQFAINRYDPVRKASHQDSHFVYLDSDLEDGLDYEDIEGLDLDEDYTEVLDMDDENEDEGDDDDDDENEDEDDEEDDDDED